MSWGTSNYTVGKFYYTLYTSEVTDYYISLYVQEDSEWEFMRTVSKTTSGTGEESLYFEWWGDINGKGHYMYRATITIGDITESLDFDYQVGDLTEVTGLTMGGPADGILLYPIWDEVERYDVVYEISFIPVDEEGTECTDEEIIVESGEDERYMDLISKSVSLADGVYILRVRAKDMYDGTVGVWSSDSLWVVAVDNMYGAGDSIEQAITLMKEWNANDLEEIESALLNNEVIQALLAKELGEVNTTEIETSVDEDLAKIIEGTIKVESAIANEGEDQYLVTISTPTTTETVDGTKYENAVQLSINLSYAGTDISGELAYPVTITMPVPNGLNVDKLVILHYSDDGSYEVIVPTKNTDGTITFTITHFSVFVFAESVEEITADTSTQTTTQTSTTTEDTTSDSESTIVVEMWKPTTPEDIFRYSLVGTEEPVYTTSSNGVIVKNGLQGEKCFDVFNACLGEYSLARTYDIMPNGKKVYTTDTLVEITLKIPDDVLENNRDYEMICVTKDGVSYILEDLDDDPTTITFKTDKFYAFALAYRDKY